MAGNQAPGDERQPAAVEAMFDRVAWRYDLVNSVLSAGADRRWRRLAAEVAALGPGQPALDVACGTGRLTRLLARQAGEEAVIGLDFSAEMLRLARRDRPELRWVRGDALRLPFADASFRAVTIAFGLRNLADPLAGLREMRRVLQPGGRAVVLEFLRPPRTPAGWVYRLYLGRLLPRIGAALSGDREAYRYLSQTIGGYRRGEELTRMMLEAGFEDVGLRRLALGTVGVVAGFRPGPEPG